MNANTLFYSLNHTTDISQTMEQGEQQDAHEFYIGLMDSIISSIQPKR